MPMYSYICGQCQHKEERFSSMAASDKQRCNKGCTGYLWIDWATQGLSGAKVGDHDWHGKEGKSLSLAFDPRKLGELRKDVPDLKLDRDGHVRFDNNSHQKRVYRQMASAVARIQEREEASNERG